MTSRLGSAVRSPLTMGIKCPSPSPRAAPLRGPGPAPSTRAAPEHHSLLFENDRARVLDTRVPPGTQVPVHTHRWPSVLYVLGWSDFVRRDEHGAVTADSRASGTAAPPPVVRSAALAPHSLENVGPSEIRVISVELKD